MGVNEIEIAWAAGFFDGEGCVTGFVNRRGGAFQLCLIVAQSGTIEHLERFGDAVEAGSISGPYFRERRAASFHWNCSGRRAHRTMALLRPYLCSAKVEKYDYIVTHGRLPDRSDDPATAEPAEALRLWDEV